MLTWMVLVTAVGLPATVRTRSAGGTQQQAPSVSFDLPEQVPDR